MKRNRSPHTLTGELARIFRLPDKSNIIERQRIFVLFYASLGYLIGIGLNLLTAFGPQHPLFVLINSIHAVLILLFIGLYVRRVITSYLATLLLILSIQIEIPIEMILMAQVESNLMGVAGILGNTILLGMLLILSITAYIRYLPYVQTAITIVTLGICWRLIQDPSISHLMPILFLAFLVLSFMGSRLVHGAASLQQNNNNLTKEQSRVFEFLNMDKEELFRLIKLTQRKRLSDKQKSELLELLDERTKASVLEVATEVIEQKSRNLSLLDNPELGLTRYEKEVCLLIIQGLTVAEIARKLKKNIAAITAVRAKIRGRLKLAKEDNLHESLLKLVGGGISEPQLEQGGSES